MSQKKNEGILLATEIRVVGSYTDRLLSGKIETGHQGEASVQLPISTCQS